VVQAPVQTHGQEGFVGEAWASDGAPDRVEIEEYGTKFQVRFAEGHKTGFFCDQRENRRKLAGFSVGKSVLDLCCYTGGFAVQSARLGNAAEVTGVDLDETALEAARENARLNGCRIRFVQSDAFGYLRDLIANHRQFDVVVVDPPKLIRNRSELESGTRAHHDLNRLAFQVVKPGGVMLTCTCSGLLSTEGFRQQVLSAARHADSTPPDSSQPWRPVGRGVQILDQTGAAPDHPVLGTAPETEYLRAMWLRVW
jgi:23S rRNA (cytosine1962-C5)-methyltransferase